MPGSKLDKEDEGEDVQDSLSLIKINLFAVLILGLRSINNHHHNNNNNRMLW